MLSVTYMCTFYWSKCDIQISGRSRNSTKPENSHKMDSYPRSVKGVTLQDVALRNPNDHFSVPDSKAIIN